MPLFTSQLQSLMQCTVQVVVFGPDGNMYVADFCLNIENEPDRFIPETGIIWVIKHI
jgi:hypothetical protein